MVKPEFRAEYTVGKERMSAAAGVKRCAWLLAATVALAWTAHGAAQESEMSEKARTRAAGDRVIGGSGAKIRRHPWQVALLRTAEAELLKAQFCGGSIVGSLWI